MRLDKVEYLLFTRFGLNPNWREERKIKKLNRHAEKVFRKSLKPLERLQAACCEYGLASVLYCDLNHGLEEMETIEYGYTGLATTGIVLTDRLIEDVALYTGMKDSVQPTEERLQEPFRKWYLERVKGKPIDKAVEY